MLKEFLEEALEAEMSEHLSDGELGFASDNKRNGKGKKTVKSQSGEVTIQTPQDCHSSFESKIIEKRQSILADNLESQILTMYGLGNSLGDISGHIKEMYGTDISTHVLSGITDRIIPRVEAWKNRLLEPVYCIAWLDAMHFKVREEGKVVHKALYNTPKKGKKRYWDVCVRERGHQFLAPGIDRSAEQGAEGHPDSVYG